jgi:hypothetical protein
MPADDVLEAVFAPAVGSGPFPATRTGKCEWTLRGPDLCRPTLCVEGPWLCVETVAETSTRVSTWWERLLATSVMEGRRCVTEPREPVVLYRSERWVGDEPGPLVESRLRSLEEGFFQVPAATDRESRIPPRALREVCREAGLECSPGEGMPEWVYLPGHARHHRAWIDPTAGGFRIRIEIGRMDAAVSFEQREATALLLLTVAGMVRLLGVSAERCEKAFQLRLEVEVPPVPDLDEFRHAVGALSTGLWLAQAETGALADERTARTYLAVHNCDKPNEEE